MNEMEINFYTPFSLLSRTSKSIDFVIVSPVTILAYFSPSFIFSSSRTACH